MLYPAAWAGGRQGSLHIFANCRQSANRIWNEDDDTSLQRKSKQPRPEPKCFKWITPVCHCDYTLLAGTATRWIVFLWLYSRSFFFLFFRPCECIYPFYYVAWSECGIVFAFTSQSLHLCTFLSLRGHFLFILEWSGWLIDHVYISIFTLSQWCFRFLACFVQLTH